MQWLFFIISEVLLFLSLFILKMENGKAAIFYSIGLIVFPGIVFLIACIFGIAGKIEVVEDFEKFFISSIISLIIICFINLMNILQAVMIDHMLGFHKRYNSANMHRQPIKLVEDNKLVIQSIFSYVFFAGSILVFYGIWFKMEL